MTDEKRRFAPQSLNDEEENRRKEDAKHRHAEHAAEHRRAQRPPHFRTRPEAIISGTTPKINANEVIRIGRSRNFEAS